MTVSTSMRCYLRKVSAGMLVLLIPFSFSKAFSSPFNPLEPIELVAEKLPFSPKEFYIHELIDEREDPSAVAWILQPTASAPQKVDLKGGGSSAISRFIQQSLPANRQLRPVIIRLKECRITETSGARGIDGTIKLVMDFEYERGGEIVHLTSYAGGASYTRTPSRTTLIEPALRQSLVSSLKYLNSWMDREAPTNIKLARGVKVAIKDFSENTDNDTVFYNRERPLRWDDFQGQPRGSSKYAASVFPSFSYEGSSEIVNGYVHLHLNMKVYVLKSSSWVRNHARDEWGLNHEQRHFDIVKGVVERFKRRLLTETFQPDDFAKVIAAYYVTAYSEMNRLQDQYDDETRHGLNKEKQQNWNLKLDRELNSFAD